MQCAEGGAKKGGERQDGRRAPQDLRGRHGRQCHGLALEAVVVGLVGIIGAVIVGIALAKVNNRFLGNMAAITLGISVPWTFIAIAAVLGIAVAPGTTYFRRRTAKRMTIIEALRFD